MSADKLMLIVPVVFAVLALSAWGAMSGSAADGAPQPSPTPSAVDPKPDEDGDGDDGSINPADAAKASTAALEIAGGGTIRDVERGDDGNPGWFEIEIQKADGTEVKVQLDEHFKQRAAPESESRDDQEGPNDD